LSRGTRAPDSADEGTLLQILSRGSRHGSRPGGPASPRGGPSGTPEIEIPFDAAGGVPLLGNVDGI
jgi:hypothetical protein